MSDTRQWWAEFTIPHRTKTHDRSRHGRRMLMGAYSSREVALAAAQLALRSYPASRPKEDMITTGYGSEGPWFDIKWDRRAT